MYRKVTADMNFATREKEVEEFWKEKDIFSRSIEQREDGPEYMFYDGPPTANGKPHIGHVLTRVIKDMIPRYRAMRGYNVPRKAGWDTHGLPVELEVERKLGIEGKEQIEEYGIEPFIQECKKSVWKYEGMWEEFSDKVGFWADMEHPYVTYHNDYIESVWWSLKKIWDRNLLYKGFKIVPYCPRCGTPLSSHEVAQGYRLVKERSAIVRFKIAGEDAYFLAWTTTPWTLPSNVALCVNPEETYVRVRMPKEGKTYILAQALADRVLAGRDPEDVPEVLETYRGTDLEYKEYEPLFGFTAEAAEAKKKKAHYIVCDDYVTMTDGTGIVHIAPAFGEDDARVGRRYDLPLVQLVTEKGEMTGGSPWDGLFVKKADPLILKTLKEEGKLFAAPEFEHDYPFCWRCDTPLLYYARDSWFIRMTEVRDDLIANNNTINWIPENIGKGRFGDWLENVQDWGLSRNRYWGTPLNIWECSCGHRHAIGSIQELKEMSDDCPDEIELHRPYIDAVTLRCPECGGTMRRVPEVIDCWYDSGSMPFAQYHYPFENEETFRKNFPAAFISEAVDQTRGWFYSLLAISTLVFNKAPYENVIVLGHVLDEYGQKMSKSKGNAVDPMDVLNEFGADAVRWYFYINSAPWLPSRWNPRAVREFSGKFLGTLWNTYAFYILYADIDGFNPMEHKLETEHLGVMDRWLLSRLATLTRTVTDNLDHYLIPETARALQGFVDELSNWYVRRSRGRFWAKGMEQDKVDAYMTLYTALSTLCRLAAPMVPFITEAIYQNMVRTVDKDAPESIHLCDFPEVEESWIDTDLEADMEEVLKAVALGRACRNAASIKNRQPVARMFVKTARPLSEYFTSIIREELNVREIEYTDEVKEFVSYTFKPQLKLLGPRLGKRLNALRGVLSELDGAAAMQELKDNEELRLAMPEGDVIALTEEELLIEQQQTEGYETQVNGASAVVLDTALTPELIEEGFVRELVSKIQNMRKDAGFEVMDHIRVTLKGSEKLEGIFQTHAEEISREVLAEEAACREPEGFVREWNINGEKAVIGVEKIV